MWASTRVQGVLLDLGVSSPQIDDPRAASASASTRPLDMRMDRPAAKRAADFLARADERHIARR